jgi:hypothetical protein
MGGTVLARMLTRFIGAFFASFSAAGDTELVSANLVFM